jgi:hypothetical protein
MKDWSWQKWVVFAVPFALVGLGLLACLLLRNTLRSRFAMERQLRKDPDINEWLVVFNWSRKCLYVPTILASLAAAVIMYVRPIGAHAPVVGGVWLAIFLVNFLIDEYEINIKALLIVLLCLALLFVWLMYLDWLMPFLRLFTHLDILISGTGYLILAAIFLSAVGVSWLKGLFYYTAITPNYINIQSGPTETGEQINREEYGTRIDTGDFIERLLGFGRIVITFADHRRPPLILLVSRIGRRAAMLESIRGTLVVDRYRSERENSKPGGG